MMTPIKSYRIETGEVQKYIIYLVGCGGTGSFCALHLARLAYVAGQKGTDIRLIFIDHDHVEPKNLGRQNFVQAEIGQPKAIALARRYSYAFGLQIEARAQRFQADMVSVSWRELALVIGCVDNAEARWELAKAQGDRVWWLDSGNSLDSGQVLIGNGKEVVIDPTGFATHVPWPDIQEPGLLAAETPTGPHLRKEPVVIDAPALSCADLLVQEAQSLMINQMMAAWIAVYAYRLILGRDLDIQATYINLAGSVRSVPVTGEVGKIEKTPERQEGRTLGEILGITQLDGPPMQLLPEREVIGVEALTEHTLRMIWERHLCPNCGAAVADGRDVVDDAEGEVDVIFCPACQWAVVREEMAAAIETLDELLIEDDVNEAMDRLMGPVVDEDEEEEEETDDELTGVML